MQEKTVLYYCTVYTVKNILVDAGRKKHMFESWKKTLVSMRLQKTHLSDTSLALRGYKILRSVAHKPHTRT